VKLGDPITPGVSRRDIAAATGVRRSFIALGLALASIPEKQFEALIEADPPATVRQLELLARRQAGKSVKPREHRCPHCGGLIRVEKL
jgi:hypothetical protein